MKAGGPADRKTAVRFGPRTWLVVRVLWWLLLPLALIATALSIVAQHRELRQDLRGFLPAGVLLVEVGLEQPTLRPFTRQAILSGFKFGQSVVGVDGTPVYDSEGARELAAAAAQAGRPLFVHVRTETGDFERFVFLRSAESGPLFQRLTGVPYEVIAWVNIVAELIANLVWLGCCIVLYRAREPVPAMISLGGLGIIGSIIWIYYPGEPFSPGAAISAVMTPSALMATAYGLIAFPDGGLRRWHKVALGVLVAGAVVFGLLTFSGPYSSAAAAALGLIFVSILVLSSISLVGRWRRSRPGLQRQQMKWAAGGIALALLLMVASVIVSGIVYYSPAGFGRVVWTGAVALLLMAVGQCVMMLGLVVALLRFRLYDAESVIGRSTAFGILTVGALAVWVSVEKVLQTLVGAQLTTLFGEQGPQYASVVSGLFAALSALLVIPVRKRLSDWTRRRLQPGVAALQADVPERLRDLRETAAPDDLAKIVVDEVAEAVRAARAAILSEGGAAVDAVAGLSRAEVEHWVAGRATAPALAMAVTRDPMFPLEIPLPAATGAAPERWLVLGPRPDGSPPGPDDRKAVRELAVPIGRALAAAVARHARDAILRDEIQSLRVELRMLRARIDAG